MNSSEETSRPVPQLHFAAIFGSILSIGFPLNGIAIWVLLRHHNIKLPNVIFMVNLAISDLLLASSLPLRVYFYATGIWPFEHTSCILAKALFSINIRCSSIFITFISVDRLLAIVYPLRSRHIRTARNAVIAIVIAWVFVIIFCIAKSVVFKRYLKQHNETFCFQHPKHLNKYSDLIALKSVEGIVKLTLVLVLLIVNILSTVLVSLTLRRDVKDLSKINSKVNVLLLFVINLVIFTVCFVPETFKFFVIWNRTVLKCLGAVNCCLDPLLYYFSIDAFWKKKEERNQLKPRNII